MMGLAVNVRNLPGHGLVEISRLARRVPGLCSHLRPPGSPGRRMSALLDSHFRSL